MTEKIIALAYRIVTLLITACLLIMVCFAWFTSNEIVSTSEIKVTTESGDIVDLEVKRYKAIITNDVISLGDPLTSNTTINSFDLLNEYDRFIYEFSFGLNSSINTDSIIDLGMVCDSTIINLTFQTEYDNQGSSIPSKIYSFLSNVSSFQPLVNTTNNNFSLSDTAKSFSISSSNNIRDKQVSIVSKDLSTLIDSNYLTSYTPTSLVEGYTYYKLSIFLDYNITNLNTLFSQNIGFAENLGYTGDLYFKDDISFALNIN